MAVFYEMIRNAFMRLFPHRKEMPSRIFKYYGYNADLNAKRLSGEIYLSSPLDFNDPCDCQRNVENNAAKMQKKKGKKGKEWLEGKMEELGITGENAKKYADSLVAGDEHLEEVYRKQLEHLGVFCVTTSYADTLMWGYYANNEGFCIEYDAERMLQKIVIGFINSMNYSLTRYLFIKKNYFMPPVERNHRNKKHAAKVPMADALFNDDCLKELKNVFLEDIREKDHILNFVKNIYIKRIVAEPVTYKEKIHEETPTLFFDETKDESFGKYFVKTKLWKHENEFRVVVSLGGKKVVALGADMIKSVYFGCRIKNEHIVQLVYLLLRQGINCNMYKMKRDENCELTPIPLNRYMFERNPVDIEEYLQKL